MSSARSYSPDGPAAPALSPSSAGAALLFAAAATAIAFLALAGAAGAVLVLTGHDRVSTSTGPAPLLALGAYASATVAALIVLSRGLHPAAAVAVCVVAAAWPLSGHLLAVLPALALIAAIAHVSGGRDLYGPPALAYGAVALVLLVAAAATARLHDDPRTTRGQTAHTVVTKSPPAPPRAATPKSPERGQTPSPKSPPAPPRAATPKGSERGQTPPPAARGHAEGFGRGQTPSLTPRGVVLAYYADLDRRDFRAAWARLTPPVQASFGGFAVWKRGFANTLASHPIDVGAEGDTVMLELLATDRAACRGGVTTARYAVRWELRGQQAAAISATASGTPVTTGCVSR